MELSMVYFLVEVVEINPQTSQLVQQQTLTLLQRELTIQQ
jgi:hypothetical protein